jgi:hypothetical protein
VTSQLFDSSVLIAVDLKAAEEIEDFELRQKTLIELKALDKRRSSFIQLCRQLYIDPKYVHALFVLVHECTADSIVCLHACCMIRNVCVYMFVCK